MPSKVINVEDTEVRFDAMHQLREPLGSEGVGLTLVECAPGWEGPEHDHAEQNHEEIYLLLDGAATVTIDGTETELAPGDAVHLAPEETRQVRVGDEPSRLVFAGGNR